MVTEVASVTDQRRVEACPRSMVSGSAVNCAIAGALGSGLVSVGGGGGGGGGAAATGAFFLHPAANSTVKTKIKIVALNLLLNSVLQFKILFPPDRHLIPALCGELFYVFSIGQHGKNLHLAAITIGCEHQMSSVRGPIGILIAA